MRKENDNRKINLSAFGLLFISFVIMIFVGCSQNPISNTADSNNYFDQEYNDNIFDPNTALRIRGEVVTIVEYGGEKLISAEDGGVVDLTMSGSVSEFEVLPNAIPQDTLITVDIRQITINFQTATLFDFSPDGLSFSTSAVLRVDDASVNDTDGVVDFYWLDPSTNSWVFQGTYYDGDDGAVDGVFEIPVDHFSKYGISE